MAPYSSRSVSPIFPSCAKCKSKLAVSINDTRGELLLLLLSVRKFTAGYKRFIKGAMFGHIRAVIIPFAGEESMENEGWKKEKEGEE
jgi:hypothetical protein